MENSYKKMMTICHIISGDLWAGAEIMVFNLLRYMVNCKDMNLFTIILNEGRLTHEIRKLGIPVYLLDEKSSSFITLLKRIINIMNNCRPDIVHSHRYKENILSLFAVKRSSNNNNIKLISTQHGMPLIKNIKNINDSPGKRIPIPIGDNEETIVRRCMLKYNYYILSRYFHCTVAVSKDIHSLLVQTAKFSEKNSIVIYNGINIPHNVKSGNVNYSFCIGSAARLFPIKDFSLFIEIARIIRDSHPDVQFMLAGDGPEREKLQDLVKKYGLGKNFKFLGFINETDDFYRDLDLYLNTSFHEGIPLSILEALAYGIPVVAPAVGGLCEIVEDGVEGLLAYSRDPLEYAKKCITLMMDKKLREKMSLLGKEKVNNNFSVRKMADSYSNLYQKMIKQI